MFLTAVYLTGKLHLPNNLEQPIPPGTEIQIRLERNNGKVIINSALKDTKLYLDITGIELHILRIVIKSDLHLQIEKRLNAGEKITYYYNRIQMSSYMVPANSRSFEIKSIFPDFHIPPLIYVSFYY